MTNPADHDGAQLRERLDRLAGSISPGGPTDGADLYRRSLRRHRRRGAVTTALVAGATAVVIVGGATWLPEVDDDGDRIVENRQPPVAGPGIADAGAQLLASVDDPGGRTAGRTVEVSRAEAERRCTVVWHNTWGPSAATVELRADSGPWFEGDAVKIANLRAFADDPAAVSHTDGRCVIPQAGLEDAVGTVPLPLPAADDAAGVRAACGEYLGWDFADWEVVVADGAGSRVAAVLRSPDGLVSRCLLDSTFLDARGAVDNDQFFADPRGGFAPFVEITVPAKFSEEAEAFGAYRVPSSLLLGCRGQAAGQQGTDCLGAGLVSAPEPVSRIVLTDAAGTEQEIPVVDGWLAFAGSVADGALNVTVYAADGAVLADY